jgi:hypothetical protein
LLPGSETAKPSSVVLRAAAFSSSPAVSELSRALDLLNETHAGVIGWMQMVGNFNRPKAKKLIPDKCAQVK